MEGSNGICRAERTGRYTSGAVKRIIEIHMLVCGKPWVQMRESGRGGKDSRERKDVAANLFEHCRDRGRWMMITVRWEKERTEPPEGSLRWSARRLVGKKNPNVEWSQLLGRHH